MDLTERQAIDSDEAWLWNLFESLLKKYITIQWGWDLAFQKENFRTELPAESFSIVSLSGEDVAAYLINDEEDHLYLKMILVHGHYQGLGIGSHIMEQLKIRSTENGKPLRFSVFDANPVLGFYTDRGFSVVGRKEGSDILQYLPGQ